MKENRPNYTVSDSAIDSVIPEHLLNMLRGTSSKTGNARRSAPLSQALAIQWILVSDTVNPQTPPAVRASLARSWCLVQDCIRELRGIPKAGQLRPDLDPVQMMKAMKRLRSRKSVDMLPGGSKATFEEDSGSQIKQASSKAIVDNSARDPEEQPNKTFE